MIVYRLVDRSHDPIEVGSVLLRTSGYSRQKFGQGMYFCATRKDAQIFLDAHHGYKYTDLLECRLNGITRNDFVDLVNHPNEIVLAKRDFSYEGFAGGSLREEYCRRTGKKGLIWRATNGWTELVLHAAHADHVVIVIASESLLDTPDSSLTTSADSARREAEAI